MAIVPSDEEERRRIRNMVKEIDSKDALAIVFRETFGVIPVIGPGLTELINLIVPNSAFERLLDFAIQTMLDLTRLGDRVDRDYLKTDAAAFMAREIATEVRN